MRVRQFTLFIIFSFLFVISGKSQAPTLASFRLEPSKIGGNVGDTILYKITVKDFKNIIGLQLAINWDSSIYKVVTNTNWVQMNANPLLTSSSFNVVKNKLYFTFVSDEIDYGVTLSNNDDPVIFKFKLVLKKMINSDGVCFGSEMLPFEINYYDVVEKEEKTTNEGEFSCKEINTKIEKLILENNLFGFYNINFYSTDQSVKLKLLPKNGVKPYNYYWGGNFGSVSEIEIPTPSKDTIFNALVWDALNDTVSITLQLKLNSIYSNKLHANAPDVIMINKLDSLNLVVNVTDGTPPFKYRWIDFNIVTDTNYFKIINPKIEKSFKVEITDADNNKIIKEIKTLFPGISFLGWDKWLGNKELKFRNNDSIILKALVYNFKAPYKYHWENGDTNSNTLVKKIKTGNYYFGITVFDADNNEIRDSILFVENIDYECFITYLDTSSHQDLSVSFYTNPPNSFIKWRYEVETQNGIFSDSGYDININKLKINNSTNSIGRVTFYYSLANSNYNDSEKWFTFFVYPNYYELFDRDLIYKYNVCKPLSKVIIKAPITTTIDNEPLIFRWNSNPGEINKDSFVLYPSKNTIVNLWVTNTFGQVKVYQFYINVGVMDSLEILEVPKIICPDFAEIKTLKANYDIDFQVEYLDENYKLESIDSFENYNFLYVLGKNFSNNKNKYLVLKQDRSKLGLCLPSDYKPINDTITVLPAPKLNKIGVINVNLCNRDSLIKLDGTKYLDSTNRNTPTSFLYYVQKNYYAFNKPSINYSINSYTKDTTIATLKDSISDDGTHFNSLINITYVVKYDDTGCSSALFEGLSEHINKFAKSRAILSPKYQTINTNESIDKIYFSVDRLDKFNNGYVPSIITYQNGLLNNKIIKGWYYLSGTYINNTSTPITAKIISTGIYNDCPTEPDTAYITVNPKVLESIEILTSSDEFFQGKVKPIKDDLGIPLTFECYPNPTNSQLTVNYVSDKALATEVSIFSLSGAKLVEYQFETNKGLNQMELDVKKLISGTYILHLRNEDHVKTVKFTKE